MSVNIGFPEDSSVPVRTGEELSITVLGDYLRRKLRLQGDLEVEQFPSGFSNLTYALKIGGQEYVLRRPPFGVNIATAHDMGREYRVLTMLKPHFQWIPTPVLFCEDEAVLGAPFYLMTRERGLILRGYMAKKVRFSETTMRSLSQTVASTLAQLHTVDIVDTGLEDMGKPDGYVARQVAGWTKRYRSAETDSIHAMNELSEWLAQHQPTQSSASFIHNDFKYDNLVLDPHEPTKVKAVLDWEMATIGDPLMDLGTTLAYWCEASDPDVLKPYNLSWLPGNMSRWEMAQQYAEHRGISLTLGDLLFYYVFGLFKVAVIAQQIYARYRGGHTKDERFGLLIHVVKAAASTASLAIEKDQISDLW